MLWSCLCQAALSRLWALFSQQSSGALGGPVGGKVLLTPAVHRVAVCLAPYLAWPCPPLPGFSLPPDGPECSLLSRTVASTKCSPR